MHSSSVFATTTQFGEITRSIHTTIGISRIVAESEKRWIRAVWDTGASITCVSERLAGELNLKEFVYIDDDCDLFIGMDIISLGDFALSHKEGKTLFSFRIPSLAPIDFEEQLL